MDLLILAAGMGSRFGGLKQIEPVDEKGNFIIDYSIYDAVKAGFDRVVFLIKEEMREDFEKTVGNRVSKYVEVAYAYQSMEVIPEGFSIPKERVKPLGTAHAIYCAKDVLKGHFAIINADDFYGADAFKQAASYLRTLDDKAKGKHANVGYFAKNTLSKLGSVKRGVLKFKEDGTLKCVVESNVEWRGEEIFACPLNESNYEQIDINTLVSMNLFVYSYDILEEIGKYFPIFLKEHQNDLLKCEYLTTDIITYLLDNNLATCDVLSTSAVWHGVTYHEDLPEVVSSIKELVDNGEYPSDRF